MLNHRRRSKAQAAKPQAAMRLGAIAMVLAVAVVGLVQPAWADQTITGESGEDETAQVTTSLSALVSQEPITGSVAFPDVTTNVGEDTRVDSRGGSMAGNFTLNVSRSNVNVGSFQKYDGLTTTVRAIGSSNDQELTDLGYAQSLSNSEPFVGMYYNATGTYLKWCQTCGNVNDPGLWIYWDDQYAEGGQNRQDSFTGTDGVATASGVDANFTPYIIELNGDDHAGGTPSASGEYPSVTWSNGNSLDGTDYYYEGAVAYFKENVTNSDDGRDGEFSLQYVQVAMRNDGHEAFCRQSTSASGSGNWSTLSNWDFVNEYSGELASPLFKSNDTTCSILDNRYSISLTSTTGNGRIVLTYANQMPHKQNGFDMTAKVQVAIVFPWDAPRLDYTWTTTVSAINWSPIDAQSDTPDNFQYP